MNPQPTAISLDSQQRLHIRWSDSQERLYTPKQLRDGCPCATCREKRNAPPQPAPLLPVLTLAEMAPERIMAMTPVGNYAYAITFADGHDTGIFTLALLRELGSIAE